MKKIFSFILGIIFFLIFLKSTVIACSIPPNILSRFYVYEEQNSVKIKYTFYTWESFKKQIENDFFKKTGKILTPENINIFSEKYIQEISDLSYNGEKIDIFLEDFKFYEDLSLSNNIFFEIIYKTNLEKLEDKNDFLLKYNKNIFSEITSLVHSYIYSEIEANLNQIGYLDFENERYQKFLFKNQEYGILSDLKNENNEEVEYFLSILKLGENISSKENKFSQTKEENSLVGSNFSKYFEIFLKKDLSLFYKIFLIFFAIFFGALHGLLPGHSKSIIGAYMMQNKDEKTIKKELFILIFSITLSHSLFIVFLALIIHFLSYGVGSGSYYANLLNSFLYIIFGIYFIYFGVKKFISKNKNHHHCGCNSCQTKEKKGFKNTFFMGIIFGLNPCIDVLILFILSFSIGNIFYATLIVLAFSLGLGIMLGLLAYFIGKGYNFLNNKNNKIITKLLNFLVLIMGFGILFIGISKFL